MIIDLPISGARFSDLSIIVDRGRHYQGCTNSSWCGIYIVIARVVVKFGINFTSVRLSGNKIPRGISIHRVGIFPAEVNIHYQGCNMYGYFTRKG